MVIAAARFAAYGKTVHPDATFTLRLGFGRAVGYEEDTTLVPWKTTFYGLYDRAASFDSNRQKLPNRYLYIDETEGSRAIAVLSS